MACLGIVFFKLLASQPICQYGFMDHDHSLLHQVLEGYCVPSREVEPITYVVGIAFVGEHV